MAVNPYTHRCDVGEIDYTRAELGRIECRKCGAFWVPGRGGWVRDPRPVRQ